MPRSILASCALLLAAAPLAAQGATEQPRIHAVEWTFDGGYYQPTGTAGQAGGFQLTRRPAWVGGSHFSAYAPGGRWGADVSLGYSPERVLQSNGSTGLGSRGTNLVYGTAKLVLGRTPRKSGISYMVGGGLGFMRRKKSVLDSNISTTNMTGVATLIIRIPLDGQVGLRLDGEDMIYNADHGLGKKLHNDFMLTAGLGVSW